MAETLTPERLRILATHELATVEDRVARLAPVEVLVLLVEVCRVTDYQHVRRFFQVGEDSIETEIEFEIAMRGWNAAMSLLLPSAEVTDGIPLMESTHSSRANAMTLLAQLGRGRLLSQTTEMTSAGLVEGDTRGAELRLRHTERRRHRVACGRCDL